MHHLSQIAAHYDTTVDTLEAQGHVLDLHSGHIFRPTDDWLDFTRRWSKERTRNSHPVDPYHLCQAMRLAATLTIELPFLTQTYASHLLDNLSQCPLDI